MVQTARAPWRGLRGGMCWRSRTRPACAMTATGPGAACNCSQRLPSMRSTAPCSDWSMRRSWIAAAACGGRTRRPRPAGPRAGRRNAAQPAWTRWPSLARKLLTCRPGQGAARARPGWPCAPARCGSRRPHALGRCRQRSRCGGRSARDRPAGPGYTLALAAADRAPLPTLSAAGPISPPWPRSAPGWKARPSDTRPRTHPTRSLGQAGSAHASAAAMATTASQDL